MYKFKNILKEHIGKANLPISALERNAGLSRGVLQKILGEESKNPTIENIIKIANVLNLSLDKLFDREEFFKNENTKKHSEYKYDKDLLQSIITFINTYFENQNIKDIDFGTFSHLVEQIYEYSMLSNNNKFADSFALWILRNQL